MTLSGACGVNVIQSTKCAHIIFQMTLCDVCRVNVMCETALRQMTLSGVQRVMSCNALNVHITSEK